MVPCVIESMRRKTIVLSRGVKRENTSLNMAKNEFESLPIDDAIEIDMSMRLDTIKPLAVGMFNKLGAEAHFNALPMRRGVREVG